MPPGRSCSISFLLADRSALWQGMGMLRREAKRAVNGNRPTLSDSGGELMLESGAGQADECPAKFDFARLHHMKKVNTS